MQIICISKDIESGGSQLAERLADKLNYTCLSRDDLIEEAKKAGIQVGKLEMAMVKPGAFSDQAALERDYYLAFSTVYLCEKAMERGLVYHGQTGHFLLPGISHVLKLRLYADEDKRIKTVMENLGLDRKKARQYIESVKADRRKWVHAMYGVSWEDMAKYDLALNVAQITAENAAAVLVEMAQLPEFKMTPQSKSAMNNLLLAAKARIKLARDQHTYDFALKVKADNGVLTVTYLPGDAEKAEYIPKICKEVPGVIEIRPTMALTNILWIQEEFQPDSSTFQEVVEISTKWGAAVELINFTFKEESADSSAAGSGESMKKAILSETDTYEGAVTAGYKQTHDKLVEMGRSGGGSVVFGDDQQLVDSLHHTLPYVLVVLGDVFSAKGQAAKIRATRELQSFLNERIRAPVVTPEELGKQYLFNKQDAVRIVGLFLTAFLIYFLVFTNQGVILAFLGHAGWYSDFVNNTFLSEIHWLPKVLVSLVVFLFVPIVAFSYGNMTNALLKLIKIE